MPQTPFNRDGRDYYRTTSGDGRLLSVDEGQDPRSLYPGKLAYASEDDYNARQAEKAAEEAAAAQRSIANDPAYNRDAAGDLSPDAAFGSAPVDLSASPLSDEGLKTAERGRDQSVDEYLAMPAPAAEPYTKDGRDYYKAPDGRMLSVAAGGDPGELVDGAVPATERDVKALIQARSGGLRGSVDAFFSSGRAMVGETVAGLENAAETGIQKATGFGTAPGLREREIGSKPLSAADLYPEEYTDEAKEGREANPTSTLLGTVAADLAIQAALDAVLPGAGEGASLARRGGVYTARHLAGGILNEAGDTVITGDEFSMKDALFIWTPTNMVFEAVAPPVLRGAAQALGWTGKTAARGARNALDWMIERSNTRAVDDALREADPIKRAGKFRKQAAGIYERQQKALDEAFEVIDEKLTDAPERLFTPGALGKSVSNNAAVQGDVTMRFAQSLDHAAQVTGNDTVKEAFDLLYDALDKSGPQQYGALRKAWQLLGDAGIDSPLVKEAVGGLSETLGDASTWGKAATHHAGILADVADATADTVTRRSVRDPAAREVIDRQLERARSVAKLTDNKKLSGAVAKAEEALNLGGEVTGARAMGGALPDEVADLRKVIDAFPDRMPKLTEELTDTLDEIQLPETWTAERTETLLHERAAGRKSARVIDKTLDDAERALKGKPAAERVPGNAAIKRARELLGESDEFADAFRRVHEADAAPEGTLQKIAFKVIDKATGKLASHVIGKGAAALGGHAMGGVPGAFAAAALEHTIDPAVRARAKQVGAWLKSKLRRHGAKALGAGLLVGSANAPGDEESGHTKALLANAGLLVLFLPHGGSARMGETLAERMGALSARERFTFRQATERSAATQEDFLRRFAAGERSFEHPAFGFENNVDPSGVRDMQYTVALTEYARLHGTDIDAVPEHIKDALSDDLYYRNAKLVESDPALLRLAQVGRFDVVQGAGTPTGQTPRRPGSNQILSELFPEGLEGRAAVEQGIQAKIAELEASVPAGESDQVARILVRGDVVDRMRAEFVQVNAAHSTPQGTLDNILDGQTAFFERRYREAFNQPMSEPARRLAREYIRLNNVGDTFTSTQLQRVAREPGALPERYTSPEPVRSSPDLRRFGLPDPEQVRIREANATNRDPGFVPEGFGQSAPMRTDVQIIDPVVVAREAAEREAQRLARERADRRRNGHGESALDPERLDEDVTAGLDEEISDARSAFRRRFMREPYEGEIPSFLQNQRGSDLPELTPAEEVYVHSREGEPAAVNDWIDDAVSHIAANDDGGNNAFDADDLVRVINSGETRAGNHTLTPWEEYSVRQRFENDHMDLFAQHERIVEEHEQQLEEERDREREEYGDDDSPDSDVDSAPPSSGGPRAEVVQLPRAERGPARQTGRTADVVNIRPVVIDPEHGNSPLDRMIRASREPVEAPNDDLLLRELEEAAESMADEGNSGQRAFEIHVRDNARAAGREFTPAEQRRLKELRAENEDMLDDVYNERGERNAREYDEQNGDGPPPSSEPESATASSAPTDERAARIAEFEPASAHRNLADVSNAAYDRLRESGWEPEQTLEVQSVFEESRPQLRAVLEHYINGEPHVRADGNGTINEVTRTGLDNEQLGIIRQALRRRHLGEGEGSNVRAVIDAELARLNSSDAQDLATPRRDPTEPVAQSQGETRGPFDSRYNARLQHFATQDPASTRVEALYNAARDDGWTPGERETLRLAISDSEPELRAMLQQYGAAEGSFETPGQLMLEQAKVVYERWQASARPIGPLSDLGQMIVDAEINAMNGRNARRLQQAPPPEPRPYEPPEPEITADTPDVMLPLSADERTALRERIQTASDELVEADDIADADNVVTHLSADHLEPHEEIFVRQEMGEEAPNVDRMVRIGAGQAGGNGHDFGVEEAIEGWQSYDGTELTPWEEYHFRQEFEGNEDHYREYYDEAAGPPSSDPDSYEHDGPDDFEVHGRRDGDGLPDDTALEAAGLTSIKMHSPDGIRNVFGRDGLTTEDLQQMFALDHLRAYADKTGNEVHAQLTVSRDLVEYRGVVRGTDFEISTRYTPGPDGKVNIAHDLLIIPPELQGQGEARKLIRDMVEAFERIGANQVTLTAAWVGRYVWAALGCRPSPEAERAAFQTFEHYIRGVVPDEGNTVVIPTLKRLKTLRDLADSAIPLESVPSEELARMKSRFEHLQREASHVGRLEFEDTIIGKDRKTGAPVVRVGKYFLLTTTGPWNSGLKMELRPGNPWYEQFKLRIGASAIALGLGLREILAAFQESPMQLSGLHPEQEERGQLGANGIVSPPGAEEQARTIRDGVTLAAEALDERQQALDGTREKLSYLAHRSRLAITTAARALASPEPTNRTVPVVPGITHSAGVARFLGDNGSLREAFDARRGALKQLEQDPMGFVDDLAESLGELSDNAPELHAEVVAQTYKVAGFLRSKLPGTVGASLIRPEGVTPSGMAIRQFALYYSAATDPSTVVEDVTNNRARKEQVDTLREVWPDTYNKLKLAVVEQMAKSRPSIQQRIRLDLLFDFGENLDRALAPGLVATYEAARAAQLAPAGAPAGAPKRRTNPSVAGTGALGSLALGPGAGPTALA